MLWEHALFITCTIFAFARPPLLKSRFATTISPLDAPPRSLVSTSKSFLFFSSYASM
ncbi:MAG: hypothetical protein KGV58_01185 [Campylobacteraceae bacterium]|nr:hypothetical protein [Campylobacteraceae bacterium]